MIEVAAVFHVNAVYEGPQPVATGLFQAPSLVQFGTWKGPIFTAAPQIVVFNTEQPPVDTSQFVRLVIDENANLTLQDGNGSVVSGV